MEKFTELFRLFICAFYEIEIIEEKMSYSLSNSVRPVTQHIQNNPFFFSVKDQK